MTTSTIYGKITLKTKYVRTQLEDNVFKLESFIQHFDNKKYYLYEIKFYEFYKIINSYNFNNSTYNSSIDMERFVNYLDNPSVTEYWKFTKVIKKIKYVEDGKLSKSDGPAVINYNRLGKIRSKEYWFNGKKFKSKIELEKHIKYNNIK